jgi:lipoprotein signal peptidase
MPKTATNTVQWLALGTIPIVLFAFSRWITYVLVHEFFRQSIFFSLLHEHRTWNSGIAFSIYLPQPMLWIATSVSVLMILWWGAVAARNQHWSLVIALSWIWWGALSNVIDRVSYGAVLDYIPFLQLSMINIPDIMIIIGMALVLLATRSASTH